jgi:hypothetical protein
MSIIAEADYLVADLRTAELVAQHMAAEGPNVEEHSLYTSLLEKGIFRSGALVSQKYCGSYISTCLYQLYYFAGRKYYVALESYVGSCSGCLGLDASEDTMPNEICQKVEENVRRAYVTSDKADAVKHQEEAMRKLENCD